MTELDLLLIRKREHEIWDCSHQLSALKNKIYSLLDARESHLKNLEQQGIDYFTITAEMARIRAEVRGEK